MIEREHSPELPEHLAGQAALKTVIVKCLETSYGFRKKNAILSSYFNRKPGESQRCALASAGAETRKNIHAMNRPESVQIRNFSQGLNRVTH
jgi:hypothetical protein